MINLKSSSILAMLLTAACAAPEPAIAPIAFYDPAIPIYNAHCSNGTITGHGMGFMNCISRGLDREQVARANGGHDAVFTAALP